MQMLAPLAFPSAPSVARMRQWAVLQVNDDDGSVVRLASGMTSETRVRLTSQIEQFEGGQALTKSGSIYTLEGPPATPEQFDAQRTRREALLAGRDAIDVTGEYVHGG
ncbi:MAG: hypothetical protein DI603_23405 [Roseateles depolymerans]|uniref:Uncharacterized protein n=1 Tax=Roseateles depolymerans TaxID=76731 RepID=A0A2W5F5R8_9BURK|nr:MAG: hypothetical protein DI603_23405 [Roseateles depolymerans]